MNGKTYVEKFKGFTDLGYKFKSSDRTEAAIFYGINRLIASNPVLVKIGR